MKAQAQRAPSGALLVTLLGGAAGALVGLLLKLAADGLVEATGAPPLPAAPFVLAGFAAGFLLLGRLVRNSLALRLLWLSGRLVLVLTGSALGTLLGTAGYLAWLAATAPGASLEAGFLHALAALGSHDTATAFVLSGFIAGTIGGTYAAGKGLVRASVRVVSGILLGSLAGLVIYSVAYVLLDAPPGQADWLARFARAVYSATPSEALFVTLGGASGALLSSYRWRLYGLITFVALQCVVLGYALYTLTYTLPAVPPQHAALSLVLFVAELGSLLMVLLYSFYTIDVASRKHWARGNQQALFSPYYMPRVAVHVPTYNEPPELVIATLRSLLALDYPVDRLLLMVADDSTDPACSGPLKAFCDENRIFYHRREERTGYKAGALNALLRRTPEDANLLAVIDADYQVKPEYLRETVGYFVDPSLGWLQTPQDYRNRNETFLTRQYYLADAYFYRTILPSRNEQNSIIFCGTMGLLRRRAVAEAGGWGEAFITEDAELSARLLNAGWNSLYINKTYGHGLIPATFEGYQRQHHRWAFGGGRILRSYLLKFLFGRFTFRQRMDYLVGTLNWFEGGFLFAIACFVLALGAADLAGSDVVTHHADELVLVGLVPLFLLIDGLTRVHLVLRRSVHLTFGGTLRMLGMWFSVKFSNMRAAVKGFLGFRIPFLRTSKVSPERLGRQEAWGQAVRLTRFESAMAFLLLATAALQLGKLALHPDQGGDYGLGRAFMVFWLAYYGLVFSAAPLYAFKSLAAPRPRARLRLHERPNPTQDVNP